MLQIVLYTVFISLTGIIAFFVYLNHLLHRAFYIKPVLCEKNPADYKIDFAQSFISTIHGKKLEIWDLNPGKSAPIIIGVHGWEISADSLLPTVKPLLNEWRVILLNTRNHGESDTEKYSTVISYKEDIEQTIQFVQKTISDDQPIILLGHSLGGAASFYTASLNPAVFAIVSISTFAEMEEMMKSAISVKTSPSWFNSSMLAYIEFRLGENMEKVSPRFLINDMEIPVLLLHGTKDELINADSLNQIMSAARRDNVESSLINNHTHSSLLSDKSLPSIINNFLNKYMK